MTADHAALVDLVADRVQERGPRRTAHGRRQAVVTPSARHNNSARIPNTPMWPILRTTKSIPEPP